MYDYFLTESFAAEATKKSRQEMPEIVATEDDGNETHSQPAALAMVQPQSDSGQSHLPSDVCMDQAPAFTSDEDQLSLRREETTALSSTQQATAPVTTLEAVVIRGKYVTGMCEVRVTGFCN